MHNFHVEPKFTSGVNQYIQPEALFYWLLSVWLKADRIFLYVGFAWT